MSSAPRRARGGRLVTVIVIALGCAVTSGGGEPAASPPRPGPPPGAVDLGDGHVLVNLVDAFIRYADAARDLDDAERRALWGTTLEAQATDFFAQVIYRKKEGPERDALRAALIDQFWREVAPRRDELEALGARAVERVLQGRAAFERAFTDFDPRCDYYLTVAFSFKGKVVDVNGADVLALGLEAFDARGRELELTIAHEQFHLYHFRSFSPSGGLYRGVWTEGLASYAAAVLVPNTRLSEVLGFDRATIDRMASLSRRLAADVAERMDSSDPAIKRAYLGMEPNASWVPPGSGYYVGLMLVMDLAKEHDLGTMVRWDASTVYRIMKERLPALP